MCFSKNFKFYEQDEMEICEGSYKPSHSNGVKVYPTEFSQQKVSCAVTARSRENIPAVVQRWRSGLKGSQQSWLWVWLAGMKKS